jgi:splicing factor 45
MFVDALSALNAVNRFDEGYEFQGRKVKAQFYMEEKFQAFIYEH